MTAATGTIVLLPYTRWPTETMAAINAIYPFDFEVDMQELPEDTDHRGDERVVNAYYDVLVGEWERCAKEERDLIVVEHDVIPTSAAFRQFDQCRCNWCSNPIWVGAHHAHCLGLVRFRKELICSWPDLVRVAGDQPCHGYPKRHWQRLDNRVLNELIERGYPACSHRLGGADKKGCCPHEPPVRHNHRYPRIDPLEEKGVY